MTILLLLSYTANGLCYAQNQDDFNASTEELLDEVLNHPKLQAPSFYSSFELYIDVFESSIPLLTELLSREDLFVKAVCKYEALKERCEISSNMNYTDAEQLDFLINLIEYITSSNARLSYTHTYTYVYTCKNNAVLAKVKTLVNPYTSADYAEIDELLSPYSTVIELRAPTISYNCHSYAWYSESESNIYWIDYPESFLDDGTYIKTAGWNEGDKIVYFKNGTPIHSGVITAVDGNTLSNITVTSKWGLCGLYEHRGDDCIYMEDDNITYTIYRLCTHSENLYVYATQNVYVHSVSCPTCGYLESEEHTLNIQGICTVCGGRGTNIEFNSTNNGATQQ